MERVTMKPDETRDERLKRKKDERVAKATAALKYAIDPELCKAPPPKRRPGHTRRPEWTVKGGRK